MEFFPNCIGDTIKDKMIIVQSSTLPVNPRSNSTPPVSDAMKMRFPGSNFA